VPIRSGAVAYALKGAAGPREGKDRPRASHGEGTERRAPALAKLSASARQIGIRQGASVPVKQSKSQQIVANAYASARPHSL